jgi:DMSO reductase anchor subunit
MVHVIGRRHALKLRALGLLLAVALPMALALAQAPLALAMAALVHAAGMLVLRWLFFAEAEHVVGLYYGRR